MSTMWRRAEFVLVAVTTFVIGFVSTFAAYLAWIEWRYPGNNAQGDIGAFFLAALVAPFFSIFCAVLSWRLTRSKYSSRPDTRGDAI